MSLLERYTGNGDVVRVVKALPSESVTSCVKVYGRFGRRRRRACRHDWHTYVVGEEDEKGVDGDELRSIGLKAIDAMLKETGKDILEGAVVGVFRRPVR